MNIELAREMSKDFAERKKIEKENKENQARNERLLERVRNEFGKSDPTGLDLVKLKLYEEQGGVCAYSLKQMSLEHLFDADYAEVDHIIPYSISFDDSYKNKVNLLVTISFFHSILRLKGLECYGSISFLVAPCQK